MTRTRARRPRAVAWKGNQVVAVHVKGELWTLAQMLREPYLAFFDAFGDREALADARPRRDELLFVCSVTSWPRTARSPSGASPTAREGPALVTWVSLANHHPPGQRPPGRRSKRRRSEPPRACCPRPCCAVGAVFAAYRSTGSPSMRSRRSRSG
jgi:hypothetical protein